MKKIRRTTDPETEKLLYYCDLICSKIDMHAEAFAKRFVAFREKDKGKVEFIEKMMLEPLDRQLSFLIDKALETK